MTTQQFESKFMEIDITKEDEKIGFSGVVDSMDSLETIDNTLVYTPFVVTRDISSDNSRKKDLSAISLIGNILEPFTRSYDKGAISYRDGRLFISGETSDEKGYNELVKLLEDSNVSYVNETIFLKVSDNDSNITHEEVYPELSQEAKAVEEKIKQIASLENINFEFDSASLSQESYSTLEKIATLLKENPTYSIKVSGHTDDKGGSQYNLNLSKERTQSIQNALISFGVAKERIQTAGYGDTRPLVANDSEENRNINRRVEFKIIGE